VIELNSKGDIVKSLQQMLNFLHFEGREGLAKSEYKRLNEDGIFGVDTEDAVLAFQLDNGLYVDGRVGPVTLAALERQFGSRNIELNSPITPGSPDKLTIETGPADKFGEGYRQLRLRSDVMADYLKVYDEVHRCGGLLTSSGGIRDLGASVGPNRSATSFHYSGRALDLFIWSGMKDPKTDPYVAERLGDRRYRVFARCSKEKAEEGALPPKIKVSNVVTYSKRTKGITIEDHFLDLTALFDECGFKPIRARVAFEASNGDALGAEWWHFQWEKGLIPGVSTFGAELAKLYTMDILAPSDPWKYRDYVFKQNWN